MKIEYGINLTRTPPPRTAPPLLYTHESHVYAHNTSLSGSPASKALITRAPRTGRL